MRQPAIAAGGAGAASVAASAGVGGAVGAGDGAAVRPSATAAATPRPLPKRRTRRFVEEVEVLRLDRDRHLVAELQRDVRRERRDEVRPDADDGGPVGARDRLFLLGRLALDAAGVDPEVRHGLAAERLDELDSRADRRQVAVI